MLRADPQRTRKSARRRDTGVAGLARYLVASTTRIADLLASNGVDAVCSRSFDDFDTRHRNQLRTGEVVEDQGARQLHRRLHRARGSRRVVVGAGRPHHHAGPGRSRDGAAVHGAVDHTEEAKEATRVFPRVRGPARRAARPDASSTTVTVSCRSDRRAYWWARRRATTRSICPSITSTRPSDWVTLRHSRNSRCGRRPRAGSSHSGCVSRNSPG